MVSEIQYYELLNYAKKYSGPLHIMDLVHDAIISCSEINSIKKKIADQYYNEKRRLSSIGKMDGKCLSTSKFCKKCNEDKPYMCFRIRVDKKSGLRYFWYICKECQNEQQKNWRRTVKEKFNKRRNDKYNNNADWKAHVKEVAKAWRLNNPEKVKQINKLKNDKKRERRINRL